MVVMALDPSSKHTGVAIFQDQELIHYECIDASSSNLYKRIDKMVRELGKIIDEYKVEKVAIEDVYPDDVQQNISVYKKLTYLQGYILHLLDDKGIAEGNIKFFTASEWRKVCGIKTGRGIRRESLKPKDISFVKSQFGIQVGDDEADAIAIGFAAVGGVIKQPQVIIDDSGFEFA